MQTMPVALSIALRSSKRSSIVNTKTGRRSGTATKAMAMTIATGRATGKTVTASTRPIAFATIGATRNRTIGSLAVTGGGRVTKAITGTTGETTRIATTTRGTGGRGQPDRPSVDGSRLAGRRPTIGTTVRASIS